jgi:transposase
MEKDRISMSLRERDVLKVMSAVLAGTRTQVEAARLLGRSERQVRRLRRRLHDEGDGGVIHKLRGRRSNNCRSAGERERVLELCRGCYAGFGPTLAAEKLLEIDGIPLSVETLRRWMISAGLWERKRHRDKHRRRRERRACFGEMIQADASEHAWLGDRGPALTLVGLIDDATSRVMLRFYPGETTAAYMDLLGRWVRRWGRPGSWYSDRHGIFRAEQRVAGYDQKQGVATQFSRALAELGMELIMAHSPQAKGRIERLWGTAQDRLVKELGLARARTIDEANTVLEKFVAWFNRSRTARPSSPNDAHRDRGGLDLEAILSVQEKRVVSNDYTIRLDNRIYQLHPPVLPGERGGRVIIENRLDGTMKVRFKQRYLSFSEVIERTVADPGAPPPDPRSLAHGLIPVIGGDNGTIQAKDPASELTGSITVHQSGGCSGRTPALPCPSAGGSCGSSSKSWRPASDHPWRGKATKPNRTL